MDLLLQTGLASPRRRLIQVTPLEAHLDEAPQASQEGCRRDSGRRQPSGGACPAAGGMKAKNTHKRSFLRELMLLCKRYDLRFDEDVVHGNLVISQLDSMGTPEEFIAWLEDADDFEATELEKKEKTDVSVAASSPMQDRIERCQIYEAIELEKKEKEKA
jgi:hypothetical protein